ncbi:polyprenyl synthetase family protein [Streptomyces xanthochromogenes]|uniref:polyprenyl synthetase family protein n=1 Tax=Streptomyces xanthochromogenes TaxID=67384 RepID=UPI00382E3A2D
MLRKAAAIAVPALESAAQTLSPEIRHAVGVHFGWWDVHGDRCLAPGGKLVRPALALTSCRAAGGTARQGLPAAVAVELVHNASLLHDDIIDRDELRHGRPTLWAQLGLPAAILAGDALFFLAIDTLATAGGDLAEHGVPALTATVQELISGEYADTLLEHDVTAPLETVEAMAGAKTGALIAQACALGALAAHAPTATTRHLTAFGAHLGMAFQCVDDTLGIWGDPEATGKPVYSDLRSRKNSLPVAAALATHSHHADQLRALYQRTDPFTDDELPTVADLVEQAGGRQWAQQEAARHLRAARQHLTVAHLQPGPAAELLAIAELLAVRDR